MFAKLNRHVSVRRIALLALALVLTGLGMLPLAAAACNPGDVRYVISDPSCCGFNPPKAWKQKQVCNSSCVWVNSGSPFCATVAACAI